MLENKLRLFLQKRKITTSQVERLTLNIQGVSGGIVNVLADGSKDYCEQVISYKHVSNFEWVWS